MLEFLSICLGLILTAIGAVVAGIVMILYIAFMVLVIVIGIVLSPFILLLNAIFK